MFGASRGVTPARDKQAKERKTLKKPREKSGEVETNDKEKKEQQKRETKASCEKEVNSGVQGANKGKEHKEKRSSGCMGGSKKNEKIERQKTKKQTKLSVHG